MTTNDVSTPSYDYDYMKPFWDKIDDLSGGIDTMKKAGKTRLPELPEEDKGDYDFRLSMAKLTNIHADVVSNLASKPFARSLIVKEPSETIDALCKDVDGKGTHIHVYANDVLEQSLGYAVHWIFVDYSNPEIELRTLADEEAAGVRPHWLSIKSTEMLDVRSAKINGKTEYVHCRFRADYHEEADDNKYEQVLVERIFEYTRNRIDLIDVEASELAGEPVFTGEVEWTIPEYIVWEKRKASTKATQSAPNTGRRPLPTATAASDWEEVERGTLTIGVIPLVMMYAGRIIGGEFRIRPLLQEVVDLQMNLYQQETHLEHSKASTAMPMLSGEGIEPPIGEDGKPEKIIIRPNAVLYAPPIAEGKHGQWRFLEIAATSLTFLAKDIEETKQEMRELGRQPLTANTGNLTTVTTAFAAQKGNSAAAAVTFVLKGALEQALMYTSMWLNEGDVEYEVDIFTDFEIELHGQESFEQVLTMQDKNIISDETTRDEARRRKILGPNVDEETENDRLDDEIPDDEGEGDADDDVEPGSTPPASED